ncbi:MAG: HNH endonuclease signature motif containing protein [Candidatus Dormibacteria bacterium]
MAPGRGAGVSAATLRWLACDASVVALLEQGGRTVEAGRSRRSIPRRVRFALQARDGTCRFPGCAVPATDAQGHHLRHWADGGPTRLDNLVTLCRFHHRRLHEGAFTITPGAGGWICLRDGRPFPSTRPGVDPVTGGARTLAARALDAGLSLGSESARALDAGAPIDLAWATRAIADECAWLRLPPEPTHPPGPDYPPAPP